MLPIGGSPAVVAHRGASAYAPENTLTAFDLALAMGADAIELDLRLTADGDLVVLHDPTLLRTTGHTGSIARTPTHELERVDAGVRPPLFESVLARYGARARYWIELKDPVPGIEAQLVDALRRHGVEHRTVVQSFDHTGLLRVRALRPDLPLVALYRRAADRETMLAHLPRVAGFACALVCQHSAVDDDLVRRAHGLGLHVLTYTVNEAEDMRRVLDLGVDGLITDVPATARAVVDGRPAALPVAATVAPAPRQALAA